MDAVASTKNTISGYGIRLSRTARRLRTSSTIALLLPRRLWWLALLICPALSTCIELTQATFLAARFATVTDVISNSIGGVLGTIVAFLLRAIVYTRDEKVIAHALWGQNARR